MVNGDSTKAGEASARGWFFIPAPGLFFLWFILWLMLLGKFAFIRDFGRGEIAHLLVLLTGMLLIPWGTACLALSVSGGKRLAAEIAFLAAITLIFVVQTILLYAEGMAGGR